MRLPTLLFPVLVLLALATACAESSSPGRAGPDRDAPILITLPVDGGPPPVPDGGPLLPLPGDVGAACESDAECGSEGACIGPANGFPDGYCTELCSGVDDCPEGATCGSLGTTLLCLDVCTPDDAERSCRAGYGCSTAFGTPICLPGCTDATDCPEGSDCSPGRGQFRAGRCFGVDSAPGDACTSSTQCPADGFCGSEGFLGWPGGVCLTTGCDPDAPDGGGCVEGATCVPGFGSGVCVAACTEDDDCRADYACEGGACRPACTAATVCTGGRVCNPRSGLCQDPFDPRDYGRSCADGSVCEGGTCWLEFETGYPGSYCVYEGCTPGEADTCPGSGVCVPQDGGDGVCHLPCTAEGTCARAGYACEAVEGGAAGETACLPGCTSNGDCANTGFVCDDTTGLCNAP